jgi:hypothetical protein
MAVKGTPAAAAAARYQSIGVKFAQVTLAELTRAALARFATAFSQDMVDFARVMNDSFADVREGIFADSQVLAHDMANTAIEVATSNLKRPNAPSRIGGSSPRFPGFLAKALQKAYIPLQDGVQINLDVLNSEAQHWARINYGAGEAAGSNPFSVEALSGAEGLLAGPRDAFNIPRGFWTGDAAGGGFKYKFGESTGQYFFPGSWYMARVQPTKGIQGKHFIEASLLVAEARFPQIVESRIAKWRAAVESGRANRIAAVLG